MSGYFLFDDLKIYDVKSIQFNTVALLDDLKIYDVKSIQFNTVALQSQMAEKEKVSTK